MAKFLLKLTFKFQFIHNDFECWSFLHKIYRFSYTLTLQQLHNRKC